MMHITAKLNRRNPTDREPTALVTSVHDSRDEALAWLSYGDPRAADETVLAVTWSRSSRMPRAGETLATTDEGAGLVAVVTPL